MIDCHYHLDETMVSVPGLVASMDEAGIGRSALIAPLCPPIEETPVAKYGAPILCRLLLGKSGLLQKGALWFYSSIVKDDHTVDVGTKSLEVYVQPDNDIILKAVESRPDRFLGWVFVNPAGPAEPVEEIERCLRSGIIGVKAHPYWHKYRVSLLAETAAFCEEKGLPLLIHLGTEDNGDFKILPEKFPRLKTIYAHAGIPYYAPVCEYAREKKNVYVDISNMSYAGLPASAQAIKLAGADKCVFGTDGPYFHDHNDRFDFGPHLAKIEALGLDREKRELVMERNFQEIIAG